MAITIANMTRDSKCPVCGATAAQQKCWVECPAYNGPICERHHAQCKYLDRLDGAILLSVCRWNDRRKREEERRRTEWQNAHYAACISAKYDRRPTPSVWDTARLFGGYVPEDIRRAEEEQERRQAAAAAADPEPAKTTSQPPAATVTLAQESQGNEPQKKTVGDERREAYFAEFWAAYPQKSHKQEAEVAAKRIALILWPIIITDVRARAKTAQWTEDGGKYIPNAATYLRHKRWEDPLGPIAEEPKPARSRAALMSEDAGNGAAGYEEAVANWRPTYKRKSP